MGIRCADHVTPLYPQKLALTSPTGGGRSVGIVRSRTKATEFLLVPVSKAEFKLIGFVLAPPPKRNRSTYAFNGILDYDASNMCSETVLITS